MYNILLKDTFFDHMMTGSENYEDTELFQNKKPVFSMEIFPPKKKANIDTIYDTVEKLSVCKPDFISVTYGAGGSMTDNYTCEIASTIKKRFGIETLAHLTV